MRDFSTQSVRTGVERDELEFDVLFVGAGPSSLAGLWQLLKQIKKHNAQPEAKKLEGLTIGLIEKGDSIGDHAFSGATLDPIALSELCPDYKERGFPIETEVKQEEVWLLTQRSGFKLPIVPPFMHNVGYPIVSLSRVVRWMAQEIEKLEVPGIEVMLLSGFAGMNVLWEGDKVVGVQTADKGVNQDGTPKPNFEPGAHLKAKITVFGEGPRGHLARELDEVLKLQNNSVNPQVYETSAKEIWEIPSGQVPDGFVFHSTGWPQADGESGGSFIYKMADNRLAIGYVISLDTKDPFADAHLILQQFKNHPQIRPMLNGGKMVEYGGKAMAIGGWYSIPRMAFSGGMLVGDSAQLVNAARFKGIHLGMKSGMCAADTIIKALLEENYLEESLERYMHNFMASWAGIELYRTRNFHQSLAHGFTPIAALRLGVGLVTKGWVPQEPLRCVCDSEQTVTTESFYGKSSIKRDDLDFGIKFDNEPCISKLDDVYASGVMHDEHQPGHLKIVKSDEVCVSCWNTRRSPCTMFCPAQVYEMHPDSNGQVQKLTISYSNCLHCKTCDIKCPDENIIWTPPEGGGGPSYNLC